MTPKLSPALSRHLAEIIQRVDVSGRAEMASALEHIAQEVGEDATPIDDLSDPRIPEKARMAIRQLAAIAFGQRAA